MAAMIQSGFQVNSILLYLNASFALVWFGLVGLARFGLVWSGLIHLVWFGLVWFRGPSPEAIEGWNE